MPATSLVTQLARAYAESRPADKLIHFAKPKLLVVDERDYRTQVNEKTGLDSNSDLTFYALTNGLNQ